MLYLSYKHQVKWSFIKYLLLLGKFQINRSGILLAFISVILYLDLQIVFFISTVGFCICTMIGFTISIELIGKRVGENLIVFATGMVFFVSQLFTSITSFVIGFMLNDQTQISSLYVLIFLVGLIFVVFIFSVLAEMTGKKRQSVQEINSLLTEEMKSVAVS